MSWLLWGMIGLFLGAPTVLVLPIVVAMIGGDETRERVGGYFIGRMMGLIGPAAMVVREQGGVVLTKTAAAPKLAADKATVDGEVGHLKDSLNLKSRLENKPFGIALDNSPVYISPLLAEMAEHATKAKQNGRLGVASDGGMRLDFEIPLQPTMPDISKAVRLFGGSTGFRDAVVAFDYTKKSQEGFHNRMSVGQTLLWIGAFAAGVGLAFILFKYGGAGGGGGGSVVSLPGVIL